jgi:hypothetical protein
MANFQNMCVISMGVGTRGDEHHPKHGDQSLSALSFTTQHHSHQARPQPTGTTASAVIAKMVTDGIPGHGVDWTSSVGDSVTDHRNFEVTLAALVALGLLVMTVTKLSR